MVQPQDSKREQKDERKRKKFVSFTARSIDTGRLKTDRDTVPVEREEENRLAGDLKFAPGSGELEIYTKTGPNLLPHFIQDLLDEKQKSRWQWHCEIAED